MWLAREVQSLKFAVGRATVPPAMQQSGYWKSGFQRSPSSTRAPQFATACTAHGQDDRHLRGGCGDFYPQGRASTGGGGEIALQDRASMVTLGLCGEGRAVMFMATVGLALSTGGAEITIGLSLSMGDFHIKIGLLQCTVIYGNKVGRCTLQVCMIPEFLIPDSFRGMMWGKVDLELEMP